MSGIIEYLSFCVWLISFSIKSLTFIPDVVCIRASFFLRLNNTPLDVYIYIHHILFTHSSINGHVSCFHSVFPSWSSALALFNITQIHHVHPSLLFPFPGIPFIILTPLQHLPLPGSSCSLESSMRPWSAETAWVSGFSELPYQVSGCIPWYSLT